MRFIFIKIPVILSELYETVRKETSRITHRNVDALQAISSVYELL